MNMNTSKNIFTALRLRASMLAMLVAFIVSASFLIAAPAMAKDDEEGGIMDFKLSSKPTPLVKDVEKSIDHLFKVLNGDNSQFDTAAVAPMLDFVMGMQTDPKDIEPAKRFGGRGICLLKEVPSDLDKILRYFYNPELPNYLLCPATLRLSGWHEGSEFLTRETPLWDELPTLSEPVMVRGREFETTSPDSFAEAYYGYDLDRLIILLKHNGKNVAISVSEQKEKSDVGRKGAILNDKDWDFFYSGIEGLNRGGMGWMDTFMYKSASVQIFVEDDAAAQKSSAFLFKWLKAGWASMNVVKRSHIYDGSLRYARSLETVLGSPTLTPEKVVEGIKSLTTMSESERDGLIEEYAKNFEIRFKNDPKLEKKEYAKVIADGGYAKVLDPEARKSVLALQKLKSMLGMETLVELSASPVAQAPAVAPIANTGTPQPEAQPES